MSAAKNGVARGIRIDLQQFTHSLPRVALTGIGAAVTMILQTRYMHLAR
jgi:hypothetical protein